MKTLVTGGAGFIGSHLVDGLIKDGYKVAVIDNLSTGKKKNLNPKARFYKIDICDSKINKIFKKEKPEIVFHYAAQINVRESVKNPMNDAKTNILGSINVLESCCKNKVKKVIFSSTGGAIYGGADVIPTSEKYPEFPLSPYGINKLAIEKYLNYYYKVFGLPFVALRLANVYGPRQNSKGEAGVIAIFCDKMLNKQQPVIYGNGKQTRDFIYAQDVVSASLLAAKSKKIGCFNIGTGRETSINDVFSKIKKLTSSACKKIYKPEKIGEQKRSCLDCSKAIKELKWRPEYDLDEGLKKTIDWFKNNEDNRNT